MNIPTRVQTARSICDYNIHLVIFVKLCDVHKLLEIVIRKCYTVLFSTRASLRCLDDEIHYMYVHACLLIVPTRYTYLRINNTFIT